MWQHSWVSFQYNEGWGDVVRIQTPDAASHQMLFYQNFPALLIFLWTRVGMHNHQFELILEFDVHKDILGEFQYIRDIRGEQSQKMFLELCVFVPQHFIHYQMLHVCSYGCDGADGANDMVHCDTVQVLECFGEQCCNVHNHSLLHLLEFWSKDRTRFDGGLFDGRWIDENHEIITGFFVYTSTKFMVYYNAIHGQKRIA